MALHRLMPAASIALFALGASLVSCAAKPPVTADQAKTLAAEPIGSKYAAMAPLEEYLSDRDAEIALARSAAPAAISIDATVLVLTRRGYQTAVEGKNGFVCFVDRAWTSPFDDAEFWNPKKRGPTCMNAPAVRSALPVIYRLT